MANKTFTLCRTCKKLEFVTVTAKSIAEAKRKADICAAAGLQKSVCDGKTKWQVIRTIQAGVE